MSLLALIVAALVAGDGLRTEVVFLGAVPAERALALWDRVIGPAPGATIIQGKSPDVIVVRDTPPRLARFRALLKALDGGGAAAHLYVRPVTYVTPSELVAMAQKITGPPDASVLMVPDDRSGQLVVRATPERYRQLDKLFRRLDTAANNTSSPSRRVIGVEPEPPGGLP